MVENNEMDVEINNRSDDYSLLAVQGPDSKSVIESLLNNGLHLEYYHFKKTVLAGEEIRITSYNVCYTKLLRED